ncbi:metallophosphoesterase family protein [Carnobacterium antarcticum]|uniref:Exonuclease SbcCD subunit D n=1 Tax=Carnobacterium antarcticum TaxID=2126436 RepID=A0ABW4NP75_9LACT|nr:DNA repair exonuclease [Carnobacterium sp. CP1]
MTVVQFIHGADLHLDSPFIGLKSMPTFIWEAIYHSTFQALTRLVDVAIEKEVDFVCLVGDIYDNDDRSVKAQAYLRNEMERLNQQEIPVYLLHGNHDYIENQGLHLEMPENVTIFKEHPETHWLTTKRNEKVAITGFSYTKRWVNERKISDYPIRFAEADYQIGLLHGFSEGLESEHGNYAPFSLGELKSKQYDYWALGHIHKRQRLAINPPVIYSGNTQGRSSKENGPKGCEWVTLTDTKEQIVFCPTATIQWEKLVVSVKNKKTLEDVYRLIQEAIAEKKNEAYNIFLSILLEDTDELLDGVRKKVEQGELLEALQQIAKTKTFVWVYQVGMNAEAQGTAQYMQLFPEEWQKAMAEIKQEAVFNELTNVFFDHAGVADLLDTRDEMYRQQILENAKQQVQLLLGIEGSAESEN